MDSKKEMQWKRRGEEGTRDGSGKKKDREKKPIDISIERTTVSGRDEETRLVSTMC